MTDDKSDNPCVQPESVEDKSVKKEMKPAKWFRYVHIALIVWAAPMFLSSISILFLESLWMDWIDRRNVAAMIFSAGYIGLFFRQRWAYWAVALVACVWMLQIMTYRNHTGPEENLIFRNIILNYGLIVTLSIFCALTCRYNEYKSSSC